MTASEFLVAGPGLLRRAVNHILEHPETWNQGHWHCGSQHCIAGHCQIIAKGWSYECLNWSNTYDTGRTAGSALGLNLQQGEWLFSPCRTLQQIYAFALDFIQGNHIPSTYEGLNLRYKDVSVELKPIPKKRVLKPAEETR